MIEIPQNCVLEIKFESSTTYEAPDDVIFELQITDPNGQTMVLPGFWAGESTWCARVSSPTSGRFSYTTSCSDKTDAGLQDQLGEFEVVPYEGTNALLLHGKLRVSKDNRHLEHADGTFFFWLGDTWWMGFTKRLHWLEEFALLTADRVEKGFTVIQIVAGLYPDMPPFDARGANEAGFPWLVDKFARINPEYFDFVDRRVEHLVNAGLVPCIVGSWGYFLDIMGVAALKKHWRYLIARYGAYPVVWCIAGEALMRYYLDKKIPKNLEKKERRKRKSAWSDITFFVRSIDGFHNLITIHPTRYGHDQLDNPKLLDIDMLQTGHANPYGELAVIRNTVKMIQHARKQEMPVVVGEVCYEGILEANRQQIQRCLFWATMLSGAAGHTYGANGIWQLNRRDQSFGASPHGSSWGETPWEDAYQLPGSKHVGVGKEILCKYPWWKFEPHPEWVLGKLTFAAGIPGELRIFYRLVPGRFVIRKLERGVKYNATWIDPKDGNQVPIGIITALRNRTWITPNPPILQDWLLLLG